MKAAAKQKADRKGWRSRIVGHDQVEAASLKAHPDNWRIHPEQQKNALRAIFGDIGWVQDVLVSKRSGWILDGHARVELAVEAGERVPVTYIDVTEDEELKVLATFDSAGGLAIPDEAQLAALVGSLELENPDLDSFLRQLVDDMSVMAPSEVRELVQATNGGPNKKRNLGDAEAPCSGTTASTGFCSSRISRMKVEASVIEGSAPISSDKARFRSSP